MLLPLRLNLTTAAVSLQEIVPYLIGDTLDAAQMRVASIYCVLDVTGSGGTVVSQSPAAFTLVSRGTTISITLGGTVYRPTHKRRRGLYPYWGRE